MRNQIPTLHTVAVELLDFLNGCGIWTQNLSRTGVCATKIPTLHTVSVELLDFKTAVGFEPRILAVLVYVQPNPYITFHSSGIVRFFKRLRDLIPES